MCVCFLFLSVCVLSASCSVSPLLCVDVLLEVCVVVWCVSGRGEEVWCVGVLCLWTKRIMATLPLDPLMEALPTKGKRLLNAV